MGFVESLKKKYEGRVETVIYKAGKDFDYIKKYVAVSKSLLVINESKAVRNINKTTIAQAFEEAISTC